MSRINNKKVLLFLGFNGVTHPVSGGSLFHPDCMNWLKKLVKENTYIDIVISSGMRKQYAINEHKDQLGDDIGSSVVDVTPVIDDESMKDVRYHEILQYLKCTKQESIKWIGLDNNLGECHPKLPVVMPNPKIGLCETDYFSVVNKLLIALLAQSK